MTETYAGTQEREQPTEKETLNCGYIFLTTEKTVEKVKKKCQKRNAYVKREALMTMINLNH